MLLEASERYVGARRLHSLLLQSPDLDCFPLLKHWQIVRSFRHYISQLSHALAALAIIDDLDPKSILLLFLDSRKGWILQIISKFSSDPEVNCSTVLSDIARVIRASLGHVVQLFLLALNGMPLFYKTVLGFPTGLQYFGGIPNPEEEVRLWKEYMEGLESRMVLLEPEFVACTCASWLKDCCGKIFGDISGGVKLIDAIVNGEGLSKNERLVKAALDGRERLEESLESWLSSWFDTKIESHAKIESPWDQIRRLILKDSKDILEERFEEAIVKRMKDIVHFEFENLVKSVNLKDFIERIVSDTKDGQNGDFSAYLKKGHVNGDVWFSELKEKRDGILANLKPIADESDFKTCLSSYFGPEVTKIRDQVDNKCESILEDVLYFIESNNSRSRLNELVPFLQETCYITISTILEELENELLKLSSLLDTNGLLPSIIVGRSLFIGRLLFALRYHSSNMPLILATRTQWVRGSGISSSPLTNRYIMESTIRQRLVDVVAHFGYFRSNPKLDELNKTLQMLCIKAHGVWINWVSKELSTMLLRDIQRDDALFASYPSRGWDVTMIKQELNVGPLELQLALPSMPSIYVIAFLYLACLEIHRVGAHILDRIILQNFSLVLFDKVVKIYENFAEATESSKSTVSKKGMLQILLDLRFIGNILSGGNTPGSNGSNASQKQDQRLDSPAAIAVSKLINKLSARLDPVDWATYEPYLWENEKQSYMSYVVLFGFLVHNRMYTVLPLYLQELCISHLNIQQTSSVDTSSRSPYKPFSNGEMSQNSEFDDGATFGFMTQAGSKFGESTSRLGSMLSDGQVTRLKDRSLSSFGDILAAFSRAPLPASSLL